MKVGKYLKNLANFDWILFTAIFLLVCMGLVALYSIDMSFENSNFLNFRKQLIFALIGLIIFFIVSLFDYRYWQYFAHFFYGINLLLLLAVLFFGVTISGTTGWFSIFGIRFQPVEITKVVLIIILSVYLSRHLYEIKSWKVFLGSGVYSLLLFGLIIAQPDLGSALILLAIWYLLLFIGGANKKFLLAVIIIFFIIFTVSWFFILAPYQKDRIFTFFNPQADPYGRGYQVRQAVIAVGSGGLFGRGLGFGSQSQLKFIPASQTDFIFAVIAEELGFLGAGLILFLWGLIFYRMVKSIGQIKDSFAVFFILGISIMFFVQIFINIGMNVGLVPVTGIPLPFLSSGGSFLLVSLFALGIVENMIIKNRS